MRKLPLRLLYACLEILLVSPILFFLSILIFSPPYRFIWIATLPLYSLVGLLLRTLLPKHALWQYLLGIPLCFAGCYFIGQSFGASGVETFLTCVCAAVLFYRARMLVESPWCDIFPVFATLFFNTISFILFLVIGIAPRFEEFRTAATVLGFAVVVANLLMLNYLNLSALTSSEGKHRKNSNLAVAKGMTSQNVVLLLVVFVVILIASSWRQMIEALQWVAQSLMELIYSLVSLMYPQGSSSSGGGSDMSNMLPPGEMRTPNPFWAMVGEILQHVVVVLAIAAFAIFLIYILYRASKLVARIVRYLLKLRGENADQRAEYTDVHESIFSLRELPKKYLKQVSDWLAEWMKREPSWDSLTTTTEKIRYLYRKTIYKAISAGYRFRPQLTPDETIRDVTPALHADKTQMDELHALYDAARYGQKAPDSQAVEDLKSKLPH